VTARARVSAPNPEIDTWSVIRQLKVVIEPALAASDLTSGEYTWRRRFWMTMASPNVVSRGVRGPARRLRCSSVRYRTYPIASATGSITTMATNGEMPVWWTTVQIRNAPRTAMSP
jgi:hypothetical protein